MVVRLMKAEVKGKYTILFHVETGHARVPEDIKVKYTVANIDASWLPVTDEQAERLRIFLKEDFGYGPFEQDKVDSIMKRSRSYDLRN